MYGNRHQGPGRLVLALWLTAGAHDPKCPVKHICEGHYKLTTGANPSPVGNWQLPGSSEVSGGVWEGGSQGSRGGGRAGRLVD